MESLTRLVTDSLARHGFDRPLDYRRLRWSRWFRCESHHSLLLVPSKPGVFALAEEIADFDPGPIVTAESIGREGHDLSRAHSEATSNAASAAGGMGRAEDERRRMLAVTQFCEADDMAFVLDRLLARQNPMRDALNSGRYFLRFVIIEDASQRRSVCNALNQWITDQSVGNAPEDTAGIGPHFAASLELTPATEYVPARQASLFDVSVSRTLLSTTAPEGSVNVAGGNQANPGESGKSKPIAAAPPSEAATNIHCPSPFPSGF